MEQTRRRPREASARMATRCARSNSQSHWSQAEECLASKRTVRARLRSLVGVVIAPRGLHEGGVLSLPEPDTSPGGPPPDPRPRLLVVLTYALAVFFVLAAVALVIVGVHDASLAETGF